MSTSWFDPRDLRCKSPFGAVPCGAAVTFCFRPERGAAITRCELLAHGEFADRWTTLELAPVFEDGGTVYRGVFTAPDDIELVWYHFRLSWADGGTSCCGKAGLCAWDAVEPWQLTVYDDTHKTPEWFGRDLTYQIFPDRFRRAKKRDVAGLVGPRTLHERWDELPEYRPNAQGEITCSDFFGGDLQGITEKLDYLASLGVTTLYLCPIFEASTNHRYDTACYERIDPLLGDEEDFHTLCAEAKKRGIHVMLDGVFNHTGRKSVYFNADGFYPGLGAAQGEQSPYYRWYNFHPFPDEYDAWWGIKNLPAVNELEKSYVDYIIEGEHSIIKRWLRAGASGWRLDVADELPDAFLDRVYQTVKSFGEDKIVIGEVVNGIHVVNQRQEVLDKRFLVFYCYLQGKLTVNNIIQDAVLGKAETFQQCCHGKLLCRIGKEGITPCLLIYFCGMVCTFADKVRIAGLWKTVLSEMVQEIQSVIGQLCLCLFLSVHLSVEWIKW